MTEEIICIDDIDELRDGEFEQYKDILGSEIELKYNKNERKLCFIFDKTNRPINRIKDITNLGDILTLITRKELGD